MLKLLFVLMFGMVLVVTGAADYATMSSEGYFVTSFPIYVQGDVEYIKYLLNSAASLVGATTSGGKNTVSSEFNSIVYTVVTITVVVSGWKSFQEASLVPLVKATATNVLGLGLMFAPSTVHIVDTRTNMSSDASCVASVSYGVVDNVPYLIALPASVTSFLGDSFQEIVDSVSTVITNANGDVVNVDKISSRGIGAGSLEETIKEITKNSTLYIADSEVQKFNSDLEKVINTCVVKNNLIDKSYDAETLLMNPRGSIFGQLLDLNSSLTITDSNTTSTCNDFINTNIMNHLNSVESKVKDNLQKFLPKCINIDNLAPGLQDLGFLAITDDDNATATLTPVNALNSFLINVAAQPAIIKGARAEGASGVDIANNLTALASEAKLQVEGAGGFRYFIKMLPLSMHFFYGLMLFLGVFVGISALAQYYLNALQVYKMYFLSFAMFELIKVGLLLVDNAVFFFESAKAADTLARSNLNGASFYNLPNHLSEIATMTGIAGLMGTMIIMGIPAMVLRGDFTAFFGTFGAAGGKYIGGDTQNAAQTVAKKVGAENTIRKTLSDKTALAKLNEMGLEAPQGVGALEYYNSINSNISQLSQGAIAMAGSRDFDNIAKGSLIQGQKQFSTTAEIGERGSIAAGEASGQIAGSGMAGGMQGELTSLVDRGDGKHATLSGIFKGNSLKVAGMTANTSSMGETGNLVDAISNAIDDGTAAGTSINETAKNRKIPHKLLDKKGKPILKDGKEQEVKYDAKEVGRGMALSQFGQDISAQGTSLAVSESEIGAFAFGSENAGRIKANETIGMGNKGRVTKEEMSDIQTKSLAGMETGIQEGRTLRKDFGKNLNKNGGFNIHEMSEEDATFNSNIREQISDIKKGKKSLSDLDKRTISGLEKQIRKGYSEEKKISFEDMIKAEADQKMSQRMGGATAFNESGKGDVAAENAYYGSKSQALSTQAKIKTQDGVSGALGVDIMDSSQKAASQMGAVMGTQEQAEKIGKEIGASVKEVLGDIAKTMASGKVQSDQNMITGAGGHESYVKASGDLATEKGGGMDSMSRRMRKKNKENKSMLDEEGNLTEEGSASLDNIAGQQVGEKLGRTAISEKGSIEETMKKIAEARKKIYKQKHKNDKDEDGNLISEEALEKGGEEVAQNAMEGFKGADGKYLTGADFWARHAELKAGSFMSSNSMVLSDGSSFSGVLGRGGNTSGTVKTGMNGNSNQVTSVSVGGETTLKKTNTEDVNTLNNSKNINEAAENGQIKEEVNAGLDYIDRIKSNGVEWFGEHSVDVAEQLAIVAGVAALETGTAKYAGKGIKLNDNALAELDPIMNEEGKVTGYSRDGKKVANSDGMILDKNGKVKDFGVVNQAINKVNNSGINLTFESVDQSHNHPVNESDDTKQKRTNDTSDNKVKHPNPPLNEIDEPIVPENDIKDKKNTSTVGKNTQLDQKNRAKAQNNWIDSKMNKIDTSTNKGAALYERLTEIKNSGVDFDELSNIEKAKIGYDSNQQAKVNIAEEQLNKMEINDAVKNNPSQINVEGPKEPHMNTHGGNKFSKVLGTVLTALGVDAYLGSQTEVEAKGLPTVSTTPPTRSNAAAKVLDPATKNDSFFNFNSMTNTLDEFSNDIFGAELAANAGSLMSDTKGIVGAAGKQAARFAPGLGLAYGAVDSTSRTMKGDYLGAAESALLGYTSTVPVVGTTASLALGGVQMATDYFGITGGNYNTPDNQNVIPSNNFIPPQQPIAMPTENNVTPPQTMSMPQQPIAMSMPQAINTRREEGIVEQVSAQNDSNFTMQRSIKKALSVPKDTPSKEEVSEYTKIKIGD